MKEERVAMNDAQTNVFLSVTEWLNLLSALKVIIVRYGFDAVLDAVEHLKRNVGSSDD